MKRKDHAVDWKNSMQAHKALCQSARRKARGATRNSALRKSNPPLGVVVVNPTIQS